MSFFLRAIVVFVVLAALAVLAWQLAETPGEVALVWHGWRIDTSASFVAASSIGTWRASQSCRRARLAQANAAR